MARDPLAEAGFGASREAALLYERGRPGYAPAVVPFLVAQFGLDRSSRVLDLAAGTGQLARLLAPLVGSVVAVEPSAAMRALITGAEALDGVAEAIPLDDGSVDAVVVGNAFHWFDGEAAVREIRRVLRPGGGCAILWNVGVSSEPEAPELERLMGEILERVLPDRRNAMSGRWRDALPPLESREFTHEQALTRDAFVDYLASLAIVATLPERAEVIERIRALAPERCVLHLRSECHYTQTLHG